MKTTSWKSHLVAGLFVLSGSILLAGCGGETNTKDKSTTTNPKQKTENKTITITPVDVKGYADELTKHKGKVVLVDFWANWCGNCKKSFPHTIKLHQTEKEHGLDVISFCVALIAEDKPAEEERKDAIKFLKSQKAYFTNLIIYPTDLDETNEALEIPDGSLPHYKLYGRDGKLIQTFSEAGEKMDAAIKKALAQK